MCEFIVCRERVLFVLEPIFHRTIWGGARLVSVYGDKAIGLGHLYSLRCTDVGSNTILNGKYAGQRLFDIIGAYPLSIALVDAASDLSIQVHPGGELSKYESYFFINAPESGRIYCGIDDMPQSDIASLAETGSILPSIRQVPVQSAEYISIGPQTVHALTAGSFVYEIEQGEENTYRLYDYGRADNDGKMRDLQIGQAIRALDVTLTAEARRYPPNSAITEKTYSTQLLANIEDVENSGSVFGCLTLLSGRAVVDGVDMKTGMTVILAPNEKLEGLDIEKCILAYSLV